MGTLGRGVSGDAEGNSGEVALSEEDGGCGALGSVETDGVGSGDAGKAGWSAGDWAGRRGERTVRTAQSTAQEIPRGRRTNKPATDRWGGTPVI